MSRRRARCWRRWRPRCPPMSPSWPPPSPTGAPYPRPSGKIKKDGSGKPPASALDRESRHPRHRRPPPDFASGAGHRLRGRNRRPRSPTRSKKLAAKGADWILANDVSPRSGIMGGEENAVHLVSANGVEDWPRLAKTEVARATRRAHRRGARRTREEGIVKTLVQVAPSAQRRRFASAGGTERRLGRSRSRRRRRPPLTIPPRRAGAGADRLRHRPAARPRRPGAAALRPCRRARRHRAQCARHHRRRLSRRGEGGADQPRRRALHRHARHAHRPAGRGAGGAVALVEVAELDETERGTGGFGSTGISG